jgi:hypothetical protein
MAKGHGEEVASFDSKGEAIVASVEKLSLVRGQLRALLTQARAAAQHSAAKEIQAQLDRTDELIRTVHGMLSGTLDAAAVLTEQPTARQLGFPGRRAVLLQRATERASRSKHAIPCPALILGAVRALFPGAEEVHDVMEMEHRVLHFLAEGDLKRYGAPAASFLSRLIKAGRGALLEADAGGPAPANSVRDELRVILRRARDGDAR